MIALGRLRIENEASIVDARNKIKRLTESLGFDPVKVARTAIVVSDLCRTALRARDMFFLSIALDTRERRAGFSLCFSDCSDPALLPQAEAAFDRVQNMSTPDGRKWLFAFSWIEQPDFQATDAFIARARQRISKLSKADQLLRVILPGSIAEELTANETVETRRHENVAVLFADIVGFTTFCDQREPDEIVQHLQELSLAFETVSEAHEVEKIKTIGDCFMATAGLLEPLDNPVLNCVRCGLDMLLAARGLAAEWNLRIGIHVGPVIAGIVGHKRFSYDLWGDTVNTASRIETNGRVGAVNLSRDAWNTVRTDIAASSMGITSVKGKGAMEIYCVERVRDLEPGGKRIKNSGAL